MAKRAIICGGSIGGLFAAAMLRRAGWEATVLERTPVELSGRGAGIVTHDVLDRLIVAAGATTHDLGVDVTDRVAFDRTRGICRRIALAQTVTSWDRVHSLLRALMPQGSYRPGVTVTGYAEHGDHVEAICADGTRHGAELLVAADGFRSAVRGQMLPQVAPRYAGYVVWRALAREADLSEAVRRDLFGQFAMFLPTGTQIVGYPIAGPGNDLRPGHRRYNFVWYVPVAQADLDDMLTDAEGVHHPVSIPPPLVRPQVIARMRDLAARTLPPQFLEILERSEPPFFTPIYDHLSPVMAEGRVALAGDAACVARPHVGMGVTKAACDAEALARHLDTGPVAEGLRAYCAERQPDAARAHLTARRLGAMIFEAPPHGPDPDGCDNPAMDVILRSTAVVPRDDTLADQALRRSS